MIEIQSPEAQLQGRALNAGSGTGLAFEVMVWFPLGALASLMFAHYS